MAAAAARPLSWLALFASANDFPDLTIWSPANHTNAVSPAQPSVCCTRQQQQLLRGAGGASTTATRSSMASKGREVKREPLDFFDRGIAFAASLVHTLSSAAYGCGERRAAVDERSDTRSAPRAAWWVVRCGRGPRTCILLTWYDFVGRIRLAYDRVEVRMIIEPSICISSIVRLRSNSAIGRVREWSSSGETQTMNVLRRYSRE